MQEIKFYLENASTHPTLAIFFPFSSCYLRIRSPARVPTQLTCLFLDSQAQQVRENFSQDKFWFTARGPEQGPDELVLNLSFPIFRLTAFLESDLRPCMTCIPLHAHHSVQTSAGQRMERVWDGKRCSLLGKLFPRIVFFQGAVSGISAVILQNYVNLARRKITWPIFKWVKSWLTRCLPSVTHPVLRRGPHLKAWCDTGIKG